jgi:hypothetical protein
VRRSRDHRLLTRRAHGARIVAGGIALAVASTLAVLGKGAGDSSCPLVRAQYDAAAASVIVELCGNLEPLVGPITIRYELQLRLTISAIRGH